MLKECGRGCVFSISRKHNGEWVKSENIEGWVGESLERVKIGILYDL